MTKRLFDIFFSLVLLLMFFWVIIIIWILAVIDTQTIGIFVQKRVGRQGIVFSIYKLRTIQTSIQSEFQSISPIGKFLRKSKLDELPQLFNILKGDMSIVGPRPDIAGYYDRLEGEQKKILELRPGLVSLAAIKYSNEESLLAQQNNPLEYNDKVIFPDKVKMNLEYYYTHTFFGDIKIIWKIIFKT